MPRSIADTDDDPAARAAGCADRSGRGRRLDARRSKRRRRWAERLPLDVLLADAIRHARDGYVVTRSQARLTAEKLSELKDAGRASPPSFSLDGKPPEPGKTLKQTGLRRDARTARACRASSDFYRGDVGREIAADLERIGSPVTRADLENYRADDRRAALGRRSQPARSSIRRRRRKGSRRS